MSSLVRSRVARVVAAIVALAAALVTGVILFADRGASEPAAAPTTTRPSTTTTSSTTTTTTAPPPVAPLTGIVGQAEGRIHRPALVVKLDNASRAHPHAGINQADLVVEERVEGDISRFAAVFQSQDADTVGPVRSTRTTDLHILSLLGRPLFASSGANASVLSILHAAGAFDVGHNVGGGAFYRQGGRPAPHNLMTSTLGLYDKAGAEVPPPPPQVFEYRAKGEELAGGAVPSGGVGVSFGGGELARFTWDAERKVWARSQYGAPHVDARGERVAPKNVVVMEIDYDHSGAQGRSRPHGITTGAGRVRVYTAGHVILGSWKRPTPADPLVLTAQDGSPIRLTPGQTFLELPPVGGVIEL